MIYSTVYLINLITSLRKDGEYAGTLKQVDLPIVNKEECNDLFRSSRLGQKFTLHKSMICAGGEHAQDTCKGDGGGPLVCPSKDDPNSFIQVPSRKLSFHGEYCSGFDPHKIFFFLG